MQRRILTMNINLIGVPIFFGMRQKKVFDLAPDKLREKTLFKLLKNNNQHCV